MSGELCTLMESTVDDVRHWFRIARRKQARFLVIARDETEGIEFPLFIDSEDDLLRQRKRIQESEGMSLRELYVLSVPLDDQLLVLRGKFPDMSKLDWE